jgi:PST family polysaccharide transporter
MEPRGISIAGSLRWIAVSQAGRIALQVAAILVLSRLVAPQDYGQMAMCASILAFATLIRDMGTAAALVQKTVLRNELVNAVFWANVAIGCLLSMVVFLMAPVIAMFYRDTRLELVVEVLSPVFVIESSAVTCRALLERSADFRGLALVDLIGAAVGLIVAIPLGLHGAGVFCLVAQTVSAATVGAALAWNRCSWRPSSNIQWTALKEITAFSGNLVAFNVLNYFHRNVDSIVIGRYLGSHDLGIYGLAYRLLLFPLQNLTQVVSRAALTAYSRHQSRPEVIAEHYAITIRGIALFSAPAMALLWALREPFVTIAFGPKWSGVADVVAWLAPVGFIQSIISTSGALLTSVGRTDLLRNLGAVGIPLIVASFAVGVHWGVVGVATAYCIVNCVWIFPVLRVATRSVRGAVSFSHASWIGPMLLAMVVAIGTRTLAGMLAFGPADLRAAAICLVLGLLFYALGCLALFRDSIRSILPRTLRRRAR